jgi:hypothetical protein
MIQVYDNHWCPIFWHLTTYLCKLKRVRLWANKNGIKYEAIENTIRNTWDKLKEHMRTMGTLLRTIGKTLG